MISSASASASASTITTSAPTSSPKKKKPSPFFTTSDLLNTINSSLQDNSDAATYGNGNGCFTLQRRLPDGQTTRQATKDEVAAADFQSKLQQAAEMSSTLSPKEKIEWSKKLRGEGNTSFQEKDYLSAMDIYLTCLVGLNNNNKDDNNDNASKEELEKEIQIPILCNLSICALKLGMYKKCIKFCNFALDDTTASSIGSCKQYPKIYYLRGKATMLLGEHYDDALDDFDKALSLLDDSIITSSNDNNIATETNVIKKEKLKLEKIRRAAKENEKKCKEGMKIILGNNNKENNIRIINANNDQISSSKHESPKGLYSDKNYDVRTHSTLRSRKKQITSFENGKTKENDTNINTTSTAAKSNGDEIIITSNEFIIILLILTISAYFIISYLN